MASGGMHCDGDRRIPEGHLFSHWIEEPLVRQPETAVGLGARPILGPGVGRCFTGRGDWGPGRGTAGGQADDEDPKPGGKVHRSGAGAPVRGGERRGTEGQSGRQVTGEWRRNDNSVASGRIDRFRRVTLEKEKGRETGRFPGSGSLPHRHSPRHTEQFTRRGRTAGCRSGQPSRARTRWPRGRTVRSLWRHS